VPFPQAGIMPNLSYNHSNAAIIMDDYEMIMGKVERLHLPQWIMSPNSSGEEKDEEGHKRDFDDYSVLVSSDELTNHTVENLENSDDDYDDSSNQHAGCVPYEDVLDRFGTFQACPYQDIYIAF
jgi:hypothetical protein